MARLAHQPQDPTIATAALSSTLPAGEPSTRGPHQDDHLSTATDRGRGHKGESGRDLGRGRRQQDQTRAAQDRAGSDQVGECGY